MPIIVVCSAALMGIAVGDLTRVPTASLVACVVLSATAAALARQYSLWCTLALVACAASLGCLRASMAPLSLDVGAPMNWLTDLRQTADAGLHAYLPEPQASLASGVLLGGSGHLDAAFRNDLRRSGLAHIVAIDGFKQVIVAATVGGWTVRLFGARLGALASVSAIVGYTLLTGAHPSAVRAGLMAALSSLAALTGRVADPLTSLVIAVLVMAAIEPPVLLELALQLSFSATLGIIMLWPRLRRRLRRWPPLLAEPIGLTLAVTLASLPVTLTTFQQVSLVSPLAHVLAVPLLPLVLISAAVLAACAPLVSLASVAAWPVWLPTTLLVWVVHASASLPAATVSTGRLPPAAALCLSATLLGYGVWGLPELRALRGVARTYARFAAPAFCTMVCLASAALLALVRPDGRLHIDQFPAGGGHAAFIRGPSGRASLVVAGRADAVSLENQVADHLAVWEHGLDSALSLDAAAERALALTLRKYPAAHVVHARSPTRLDIGGIVLDVGAQDGMLISVRSAPTTSAARPGSAD